jgi:hypothetical protein
LPVFEPASKGVVTPSYPRWIVMPSAAGGEQGEDRKFLLAQRLYEGLRDPFAVKLADPGEELRISSKRAYARPS